MHALMEEAVPSGVPAAQPPQHETAEAADMHVDAEAAAAMAAKGEGAQAGEAAAGEGAAHNPPATNPNKVRAISAGGRRCRASGRA